MNTASRTSRPPGSPRMKTPVGLSLLLVAFFVFLVAVTPATGTSTELHIVKVASDGYTVLKETRVTYLWMEQNLPVRGDGTTHYYLQGPVFVDNQEDRWNPAEDTNVQEKDMGAVKGTDVRDLCDLVGGMAEGDVLTVKATDGFSREYAYGNVYSPPSRQGPMVIVWYQAAEGYVPSYQDGMRLLFLADTSSNPWGIHALGVWDWHESAEEKYWYYYYDGTQRYPTTTGLSVRSVSELSIASQEEPAGSIRVTSEPGGASVLLDSVETGLITPCTIPDLYPGPYMVGVMLPGYDTPEDQDIEVVHGETAEAAFVLEKSADTGSPGGNSEDSYPDVEAGTSGILSLSSQGTVQGDLVVLPITGIDGPIRGGEERNAGQSLPFSGNFTPIRLCIFSAGYSNPGSPGSAGPSMQLVIDGTTIPPGYTATDQAANAGSGTIATTCWDLIGVPVRNDSRITLIMKDDRAATCTVRGGVLIAGTGEDPGSSTNYRIFEGADTTRGNPGAERAESETLFEFLPGSGESSGGARLILVTTGRESKDNAAQFRVQLNEDILTGSFPSGQGPMWIGELNIPPPEPGTEVSGSVRTLLSEHDAEFGENRLVVLAIRNGNGTTLEEELPGTGATPLPCETGAALTVPVTTAPANLSVTATTAKNPGDLAPGSPLVAPPPRSILDRIIDAIFSFIFAITGGPPITYENASAPPGQPATQPVSEEAEQQEVPAGLQDGNIRENISNHETGDITEPVPTQGETVEELIPASGPEDERGTPYGGLWLESLPSDIALKIDNKPVPLHLPCAVYGLKAGSHLIRGELNAGGGNGAVTRTVRAWVYPGAMMRVRLDLVGVSDLKDTRILTEDGSAVSFTVDGRYPVRKTPTEVAMEGSGSFITVLRNNAYLTFSPPPAYSGEPLITIPVADPGLHTLLVESSPVGAEVFVDGIRTGLLTPCPVTNVSEGFHRITVSVPGYIPGETLVDIPVSRDAMVKAPARFTLERYPWGDLEVRSGVDGAEIFLDGFSTGEKTPSTLRFIPIGVHEVMLRLGDESRAGDVTVKPGEVGHCYLVLG
jgi:hypothetical protein